MKIVHILLIAAVFATGGSNAVADAPRLTAEVMSALDESDWRQPEQENLLYMRIAAGTIVIELAPGFAPQNIANIIALTNEGYFDGLAIIRSQDNYVVQWGDPNDGEENSRPYGSAAASAPPEFLRSATGVEISAIDSRDAYADVVGFADGFPVAGDGKRVWLAHCYGMVGVARGNEIDSGNGSSLYVITGHAPRHLDRNITLVGRVLTGIEHLATLPRGGGALGFYETTEEMEPIVSIRTGDEMAARDQAQLDVLRTDTKAFEDYVISRAFRHEEWFVEPTGKIELCNVIPPVRTR